jgi:hypothetical protein
MKVVPQLPNFFLFFVSLLPDFGVSLSTKKEDPVEENANGEEIFNTSAADSNKENNENDKLDIDDITPESLGPAVLEIDEYGAVELAEEIELKVGDNSQTSSEMVDFPKELNDICDDNMQFDCPIRELDPSEVLVDQ